MTADFGEPEVEGEAQEGDSSVTAESSLERMRAGHAAQLDRLLEENARLRRALEGRIDPTLIGAGSTPGVASASVERARRLARKVVPKRYHRAISTTMKRLGL